MADIKISQLPADTNDNLHDDDVMPIVDSNAGVTKKISLFELDKRWRALPAGGATNQVLAKLTNLDGEVYWVTINKTYVGLGNVNNTADIDKPLSTAMITALNDKATKASVLAKADQTYVDAQLLLKQNNLPTGTDGQVLTLVSGIPAWEDPTGGGDVSPIKYWAPTGNINDDGTWRERVDGTLFLKEVRKASAWVLLSSFDSNDV